MKYVLKASDVYYGLSISELRALAFQFAKSIQCSYPESWNKNREASKDWYYSFMSRNPQLSLRTPEQISQNRAKAFCKENVDAFFENFRSVLDATTFEAHRIWNMDETGLPTVPSKVTKIIARKGRKRIGSSTSAERGTNVSMALAVNATGASIPPFFIFPRNKMKAVYMTHASHGADAVANGSGWMTSEVFLKYMEHFIKYSGARAGSPTLLLLDNHASHLSIDVIDMAIANDITMLSFPPHCTHRMQPLDITVFGPLKTMYAKQHDDWKRANMNVIFDLHHVPLVLEKCLDVAVTPKNIKAGFKASGIFPFDANAFTEVDFVASQLSGKNQPTDDDNEEGDNQRRIIITAADISVAHEEVTTSKSSAVASTSGIASHADALIQVGPLKMGEPKKKSNRGRKPMQTAILTSPEVLTNLREKAAKKQGPLPKKRRISRTTNQKLQLSLDEEKDIDFCIICYEDIPAKLTKNNSTKCIECGREVHAQCVTVSSNIFTCKNCESD